jgi:hypothetical protein
MSGSSISRKDDNSSFLYHGCHLYLWTLILSYYALVYNNIKKSPNIHLMGDFNFPAIDWNENTGPNSKHICQSEGKAFIDILSDHHMEQMIKHDLCPD